MSNVKRDRLVESAMTLFHRRGMASTSLADIAKHADIPIGNVYYYFKTKDELALAAVDKHKTSFDEAYLKWNEQLSDPRHRLIESMRHFEELREEYTKYGCPIGKIVSDSDTEKDPSFKAAAHVLERFVDWASGQFEQLGYGSECRQQATFLMSGIQGAAIMAKATGKPDVITDEVNRLIEWLQQLPNKKIFLGKAGMRMLEAASA